MSAMNREHRLAQDAFIDLINLIKLKLVLKYGPEIKKKWAPRVRNIQ